MARNVERRRKPRRKKDVPNGIEIDIAEQPGRHKTIVAKLADLSDFGCGADTTSPVEVGIPVVLRIFCTPLARYQQRGARVMNCRLLEDDVYRVGFVFDEPALDEALNGGHDGAHDGARNGGRHGDSSHRTDPTVDSSFVDYYEALQLSPNADVEATHRSYRMLAQRYHPDNTDTGNEATFRLVLQAYRVISDPEKRAAYDVKHRASQSLRWKIFSKPEDAEGYDEEKRKRWGLLMILYTQRKRQPDKPGVSLRELENMLGCPREQLQFTVWYLSGKSLIQPTDAGRYTITFDGVDHVEDAGPGEFPSLPPLLEAPRVLSEESTQANRAANSPSKNSTPHSAALQPVG